MRLKLILIATLLSIAVVAAGGDQAKDRALLMDEVTGQMSRYFGQIGGVRGLAPEVERAMR
ncbi:MAG: hypothetical protein DRQ37_01715, partial [Gammaproteobacteria bacterium]